MSNDSFGGEDSEGAGAGGSGTGGGDGGKMVDGPLTVLVELALEADNNAAARIGPIARELMAQLSPRDAVETMLVTQMIATFSRSMFLSRHANKQKNPKWFALYSEECDRTMNLYRKQMQALAEYRQPRRRSFTAIRTANFAGQQVVVSGSATSRSATGGSVHGGSGAAAGAEGKEAGGESDESAPQIQEEDRLLRARLKTVLPVVGQREEEACGGDSQGQALGA